MKIQKKVAVPSNNTDYIYQIQNKTPKITINEQLQTTKILGIYFNESIKQANQINWDNTPEKWRSI